MEFDRITRTRIKRARYELNTFNKIGLSILKDLYNAEALDAAHVSYEIRTANYEINDLMTQAEMARHFGVSRSAIYEAFKRKKGNYNIKGIPIRKVNVIVKSIWFPIGFTQTLVAYAEDKAKQNDRGK